MSLVVVGCTEPNPFLDDDDEMTSSSSGDPTSSSTLPTDPSTSGSMTTTGMTTTGMTTTSNDPSTSTTSSDTTEDDSETAPTCGGGRVCVAPVPAGWNGPVIWADTPVADEQPSCPADYPEQEVTAFSGLQASPAECGCECGNAVGVSCGAVTADFHGTDSNCVGSPDQNFPLIGTNCNPNPSTSSQRYWSVDPPGVTGGSCEATPSEVVPPATWTSESRLCGGASPELDVCSGGGLCMPTPTEGFESRICVWQPGDIDCPSGAYSEEFDRSQEFSDSRNCTQCTCEDPTGDCTGTVALFYSNDCTSTVGGQVPLDGSCFQSLGGQGISSVRRSTTVNLENLSCAPANVMPVGEAEPSEPITLCCMDV